MKFETFKSILENLLVEYKRLKLKEKKLNDFFNNSNIELDLDIINSMLHCLKVEFNDEDNWVDWYFYEVLVNNAHNLKIINNDKEYRANYRNMYEILIGNLK